MGSESDSLIQNIAIAISSSVYERMQGVGSVGGIVGVSSSPLSFPSPYCFLALSILHISSLFARLDHPYFYNTTQALYTHLFTYRRSRKRHIPLPHCPGQLRHFVAHLTGEAEAATTP